MKPWPNRRLGNTGIAVAAKPWSRAITKDETDSSAMSNSPFCRKRVWRVIESMLVATVRSIPSGRTVPSLRARVISMSAHASVRGRRSVMAAFGFRVSIVGEPVDVLQDLRRGRFEIGDHGID